MRYEVQDESLLGHSCCFEATVVDTTYHDLHAGYVICECPARWIADKIAEALNAAEESKKEG